jgi:transcriptional regulator NrdR family protein
MHTAAQKNRFDQSDDRGLRCHKCDYDMLRVVYTRRRTGGVIMRRRQCLNCGSRITTWERAIGR